jgi:hypothetical protein
MRDPRPSSSRGLVAIAPNLFSFALGFAVLDVVAAVRARTVVR